MSNKRKKKNRRRSWWWAALAPIAAIVVFSLLATGGMHDTAMFQHKAALLRSAISDDAETQESVPNEAPKSNQVVFISVSDGDTRAQVFTGTGETFDTAWDNAVHIADSSLRRSGMEPLWVKADVLVSKESVDTQELTEAVISARHEFFRQGVALDEDFETALLEAEMNGAKIYDYDNGGITLKSLNNYLKGAGRNTVSALPDEYILFQTRGWLCDEDDEIYPLLAEGYNYGRRDVDPIDADYTTGLIMSASEFLEDQVQEDGSFVYGIYPRFDRDIENYNIVRHASTLWSLICRYRLEPSPELAEKIDRTIDYLLQFIRYDDDGRAYLYEEKNDEIKLGGCGVAVVALTEYMGAFDTDKYKDVCEALGEGILSMMNQETGTYYHVLDGTFRPKEEFRTVYYDGEATFALCRLYALTGEQKWLNAAMSAVDHFIEADYAQYKDHWIAYAMNELTQYVTDRPDYYAFALDNAAQNLETIRERDTTYHTYLELLMATFETYDRMVENGIPTGDFDEQELLSTIAERVDRQLNGYFYPEYAMYMKNPNRILGTFMVRHDGYRVRIDDVQHNIGGLYLYSINYDEMKRYGLDS